MAHIENVFSPVVLMIDNETLSLRPDAYLTQVGFVVGNVLTGQVLMGPTDRNMMSKSPSRAHIDPGTVQWWMTQSDAARKAVFGTNLEPTSPHALFDEFRDIVTHYGKGLTVWASPAMFDLPQLTMAWKGRKPWKYNAERDMMTLYKMLDPYGQIEPPPMGEQHVASADALWQFHYLEALVGRLKDMADTDTLGPKTWANILDGAEAA